MGFKEDLRAISLITPKDTCFKIIARNHYFSSNCSKRGSVSNVIGPKSCLGIAKRATKGILSNWKDGVTLMNWRYAPGLTYLKVFIPNTSMNVSAHIREWSRENLRTFTGR